MGDYIKRCLDDKTLYLLERGKSFVIYHMDDAFEVEKAFGATTDVYAEKVDRVVAYIRKSTKNIGVATAAILAKDLIKSGFEALPEGVVKSDKPCAKCGAVEVWVECIGDHDDHRITCQNCRYTYCVDGADA